MQNKNILARNGRTTIIEPEQYQNNNRITPERAP